MQQTYSTYDQDSVAPFFACASHDDIKWTINYLVNLLEVPEQKRERQELSMEEAMDYLDSISLDGHNVPGDFNGMRFEGKKSSAEALSFIQSLAVPGGDAVPVSEDSIRAMIDTKYER